MLYLSRLSLWQKSYKYSINETADAETGKKSPNVCSFFGNKNLAMENEFGRTYFIAK